MSSATHDTVHASLSTIEGVDFYSHRIQRDLLKHMADDDAPMPMQYVAAASVFRGRILQKVTGYVAQDKRKNRTDTERNIGREEAIRKLAESGMRCYYCTAEVFVVYATVRDAAQWTLDRIDNDVCHMPDNVVVSCLACNLKKGMKEEGAFLFTSQLVVCKMDSDEDDDFNESMDTEVDAGDAISSIEYSQYT